MDKKILSSNLRKHQHTMEQQYLIFGNLYQSLYNELERSFLKEMKRERDQMTDGIGLFQNKVSKLLKSLTLTHKKSCRIEDMMKVCIQYLQNQRLHINNIMEYSELLEMISLNVLILTIKSGSGSGLTDIAHKIKDKSTDALHITDDMSQLLPDIEDIEKSLQTISSHYRRKNNANSYHCGRAANEFNFQKENLKNIRNFHRKQERDFSKIKPLIMTVMGELQMQDIYRQSLDHIHLFMEQDPHDSLDKKKSELHQSGFDEILCQFASPIVSEVITRMDGNIVSFSNNLKSINNIYMRGIEQREDFFENQDSSSVSPTVFIVSIQNLLENTMQGIMDIDKDKESILTVFSLLNTYLRNIKKKISFMENCIQDYQTIIRQGRNILKNNEKTQSLNNNLNDIDSIICSLEKQVFILKGSINGLSEIRSETRKTMNTFSRRREQILKSHDESLDEINREARKNLDFFRDIFHKKFSSHKSILHFFKEGEKVLSEFMRIRNDLDKIKKEFENFEKINYKRKVELMDELNMYDWIYSSEQIDKILDRFTIHRQKLTLTHLSGMREKEKTLDEGSITLF